MRNSSLVLCLTALCCLTMFNSCQNRRITSETAGTEFAVYATAQSYIAALGKGRGVLFHVYFSTPDSFNLPTFKLDSLIIHGKNIPSTWSPEDNKPVIEGNYFVAEKEPGPGEVPLPGVDAPDPVLYLSEYLPASLYFHYEGKPFVIPISQFKTLTE